MERVQSSLKMETMYYQLEVLSSLGCIAFRPRDLKSVRDRLARLQDKNSGPSIEESLLQEMRMRFLKPRQDLQIGRAR